MQNFNIIFSAFADELQKIAEQEEKPPSTWQQLKAMPWKEQAKYVGALGAGTAVGTGAGYLIGELISKSRIGDRYKNLPPSKKLNLLNKALPILSGAAGLATMYHTLNSETWKNRIWKDYDERVNQNAGGVGRGTLPTLNKTAD